MIVYSSTIDGLTTSTSLGAGLLGLADSDVITLAEMLTWSSSPYNSGYLVSPYSDLKIVWGSITIASGATATWTFPATFSNRPLVAVSVVESTTTDRAAPKINATQSTSSVVLRNTNGASMNYYVMAAGQT